MSERERECVCLKFESSKNPKHAHTHTHIERESCLAGEKMKDKVGFDVLEQWEGEELKREGIVYASIWEFGVSVICAIGLSRSNGGNWKLYDNGQDSKIGEIAKYRPLNHFFV